MDGDGAARMTSLEGAVCPRMAHRVRFEEGVFEGEALASLLEPFDERPARALFVLDDGLGRAQPDISARIGALSERLGMEAETAEVPGGETCKNERGIVEGVLERIRDARLCRRSYVVAAGGGAVLDAAGFAAAIAHRGVRLVRVPSTTLSQADSGVGVKCGINGCGVKNFLGAFGVPWGVVIDHSLLRTLPERAWRSGFAEVVKVALVRDRGLFEEVERGAGAIVRREEIAERVIRRSAALHHAHICGGGDPFEMGAARPLDFGHWSAHRLEEMTSFEVSHGEAVAIGIAIDVEYARLAGMLPDAEAGRVRACLAALGFEQSHEALRDEAGVLEGLESFREHLGGRLTLTMPTGIGRAIEVGEVDEGKMRRALARVREGPARHAAGAGAARGVR
jgi:3-dehydroquinate synthase